MDLPGLALTLLIGLLIAYAASVAYCAWILTHPPRRTYGWAVARALPGDPSELRTPAVPTGLIYTAWTLDASGRALPVWDITGLAPTGPAIVFTHGWGDSRVVALPRLAALATIASRLVTWDLPGHGDAPRSAGICRLGSREAADLAALVRQLDIDPGAIILAGSSLGAGVSIEAAGRGLVRPRAVLAEAPYRVPIVPARNVMRNAGLPYRVNLPAAQMLLGLLFAADPRWPWGGGRGPFDRARWAERLALLNVPLLVLHGDRDEVCPLDDARDIAAAGNGSLAVIDGAEHNTLWTDPAHAARSLAAVQQWLRTLPAPAPLESRFPA
jgi:pimeloyl-ACP methyl ester carboxylesterase